MAPSPSPEILLNAVEAELLLDIADETIIAGLRGRLPLTRDPADLPPVLRASVGSFVTITVSGELNGCIGSIVGSEPLGAAVARHAWAAAFSDPRLPALRPSDYEHLTIDVSVLSRLAEIPVGSHRELLADLRPGVDGLVIDAGRERAVFLPAVWEALPGPDEFLDQLYAKAGLVPGSWPDRMQAFRFTTEMAHRGAGRATGSRSAA
jgi:AmmeMemoRadiSam system protein A